MRGMVELTDVAMVCGHTMTTTVRFARWLRGPHPEVTAYHLCDECEAARVEQAAAYRAEIDAACGGADLTGTPDEIARARERAEVLYGWAAMVLARLDGLIASVTRRRPGRVPTAVAYREALIDALAAALTGPASWLLRFIPTRDAHPVDYLPDLLGRDRRRGLTQLHTFWSIEQRQLWRGVPDQWDTSDVEDDDEPVGGGSLPRTVRTVVSGVIAGHPDIDAGRLAALYRDELNRVLAPQGVTLHGIDGHWTTQVRPGDPEPSIYRAMEDDGTLRRALDRYHEG